MQHNVNNDFMYGNDLEVFYLKMTEECVLIFLIYIVSKQSV